MGIATQPNCVSLLSLATLHSPLSIFQGYGGVALLQEFIHMSLNRTFYFNNLLL